MSLSKVAAVLATVLSMTLASRAVTPSNPGVQSPISRCETSVSGVEFPQLIPSQFVWESVFDEAGAAQSEGRIGQWSLALGIDNVTSETLIRTAQSLRVRLESIGRSPQAMATEAASVARQIAGADAVLEARDDVLRSLPADALSHLQSALWARRRAAIYTLPIAGSMVQTTDGQVSYCKVEVIGHDRPDLIPEVFAWESYFRHLRDVAQDIRRGDTYAEEGLTALQTYHLPISVAEITLLLDVASKAATGIESLRDSGNAEAVEHDVNGIVEGARVGLLRSVSRSAWMAIAADARRGRTGSTYVYPPALPQPRTHPESMRGTGVKGVGSRMPSTPVSVGERSR